MDFLFIVQGEGRGHMTQAIALQNMLIKNGHKVCHAFIGKSSQRDIPDFFQTKIKAEVTPFESPNFVKNSNKKGIKIFHSIIYNLFRTHIFIRNLRNFKKIIDLKKPDAIINFYDLHGGLLYLLFKPKIPCYCVAHQYFLQHPEFTYPSKKKILQKSLLNLHTKVTSIGVQKKIGLSFYEASDISSKKLAVTPPLLREEILNATPENNELITGYILNQGFADDIIRWHKTNNQIKLDVFWDKKDTKEETFINNNITFHKISDKKFIDKLKSCNGYFSTAGFESICEAMYLGKPVLINPSKNHYEQECNAVDAVKAGAGVIDKDFNLTRLLEIIPDYKINDTFISWVKQAEKKILEVITR